MPAGNVPVLFFSSSERQGSRLVGSGTVRKYFCERPFGALPEEDIEGTFDAFARQSVDHRKCARVEDIVERGAVDAMP